MHLTERPSRISLAERDRPAEDVVVTPEMIEAGRIRLSEILQAQTGLAYGAEEVYRAMAALIPAAYSSV